MSKKGIAIILSLILAGWIAFVSYWYVCKIKGHCLNKVEVTENNHNIAPPTPNVASATDLIEKPAFTVSDGNSFSISNDQNLSFGNGTTNFTIPDSLSNDFAKLAEFLSNHENKNLQVRGFYTETESLGLERANKIKVHFINNYDVKEKQIISVAEQISDLPKDDSNTYGAIGFDIVESDIPVPDDAIAAVEVKPVEKADPEPVIKKTEEVEVSNFSSSADSDILSAVKKNFTMYYPPNFFYMNTTRSMDSYFKKLAKYFKQNPNGLVELKGYSDYEKSDISLKTLGKEKAVLVKNHLVKQYGINPVNLKTKGSSRQEPQFSDLDKAKNRKVTFNFIK